MREIIKLGEGVQQDEHVETESWVESETAMRGGAERTIEYEVIAVSASHVDASGVIVHSANGVEQTLQILNNIQEASARGAAAASETLVTGTTRTLKNDGEFKDLVARVQKGAAAVVLRKVFLYTGSASGCTVSQEIWIRDKQNPDSRNDPLKEYAILHVHHHAGASRPQDIVAQDLAVVDAVNARHLAATGIGYQRDNPFFKTFVEPSGEDTLKVFPDKQWVCGTCGQKNFQKFVRCRGGKPGKCGAPRTCTGWNWKKNPQRDAGLAKVLTLAEQAVVWPSRSKKDRQRGGELEGPALGNGAEEFMLGELMAQYKASRAGLQAGSDAAESGESLQETWDEEAGAPHEAWGALSPSAGANFSKSGSFGEECPDPLPSPFTVLFVGANVKEQTKLQLDTEFEKMRMQFLLPRGEEAWEELVVFDRDCFATPDKITKKLMGCKPTILHLACHGETEGLHVGSFLGNEDLAEAILALNKFAQPRIRLVIANACMSGKFAARISRGVEFVIGHGELGVKDVAAIAFSEALYRGLGSGYNLWASFLAAQLSSKPYQLFAPLFDPEKFFLRAPLLVGAAVGAGAGESAALGSSESGHVASGESSLSQEQEVVGRIAVQKKGHWLELVEFLAVYGLDEIADRLHDRFGVAAKSDLGFLRGHHLADVGWLKLVERAKLIAICEKVTAELISAKGAGEDMDDSRSAASGANTMEVLSDSFSSSDDETGNESAVVAVRNEGDIEDLVAHLQQLAVEFKTVEVELFPAYMLLLVKFMQDATFPDMECEREWHDFVNHAEGWYFWEEEMLDCFDRIVLDERFRHPLLDLSFFCSHVYVLDLMVRRCDPHAAARWDSLVVCGEDLVSADPWGFLERASKFLRQVMDGIMHGEGVTTQSYCVFLHMSKLASLLLFEHLEARRRRANAVQGTKLNLDGFRLFISSERRTFGVAKHDIPSRRSLGVIHRGLRCMAGLPRESVEKRLVPLAAEAPDKRVAEAKKPLGREGAGRAGVSGTEDWGSMGHTGMVPAGGRARVEAAADRVGGAISVKTSEPIWKTLGFPAARGERQDWLELLAQFPAVEEHPRDEARDWEILCGHEVNLARLQPKQRVVKFLVSSTFTVSYREERVTPCIAAALELARFLCIQPTGVGLSIQTTQLRVEGLGLRV